MLARSFTELLLGIAIAAGAPLLANSPKRAETVRICLIGGSPVAPQVLLHAQIVTSRILSTAGVTLEWHMARDRVCQSSRERVITLHLVSGSAPGSPQALGVAFLHGPPFVVVRVDRIEEKALTQGLASILLGHTMAHEIAHSLERSSRHSNRGLMKVQWDSGDFREMVWGLLPFTNEDVILIQKALHAR